MTSHDSPLTDSVRSTSVAGFGDGLHENAEGAWPETPALPTSAVAPFSLVRSIATVAAFAFVWAAMVWGVQYLTTAPTLWKEPLMLIKDNLYRFLLDWSVAYVLLSVSSTRVLAVLFALNLWAATAIISFFLNYQRALSWLTISNQSSEGFAVALVALEDASPYLGVMVPLSVALVWGFDRLRPRLVTHKQSVWLAAACWLAVLVGMHVDHKPLHRLEKFESTDGIAYGYGYVITWLAESYYVSYDGIAEHALERLKKPVDKLTSVVAPVEIGDRLAVIQVESLDDALIGMKIKGQEVTPRLNRWSATGTYLRVQAPKVNGSCDADFALLFGALPSNRINPYRVPHFPFDRAMSNVLHDRGFSTSFFHGVNGTFFERRTAFADMKFDRVVFREELIKELSISEPEWTIEDGRMFAHATKTRASKDRFFEFSITGTSHTPFRFSLEDHPRVFYPDTTNRDFAYFDTMSYVDRELGEYVDGLPEGTVVLLYGDHFSRVTNPKHSYESQLVGEFGIVPAFLFKTTKTGIEPLFEMDRKLAQSTEIRLVDVTAWLRKSLHIAPASEPYKNPTGG